MTYDKRHGSPYDRGRADFYYRREFSPHYFEGKSYQSRLVELQDMTPEQITAYSAGYRDGEADGEQKHWGEECL